MTLRDALEAKGWTIRTGHRNAAVQVAEHAKTGRRLYGRDVAELVLAINERSKQPS